MSIDRIVIGDHNTTFLLLITFLIVVAFKDKHSFISVYLN